MIPYSPHPILFTIGPLAIRYYSIAYLIGFVLGYLALRKEFGKEIAEDASTWIILATIIGGRLGEFLFWEPRVLFTDPLEVLKIWHGGMSFHGALLALVITMCIFCKKRKLSFWRFADAVMVPAALALTLGRIANFLNGELVGTVTNVAWCMHFPGYDGCRHPSQLYESLYSLAIAGVLFWQSRKKHQEGFLFASFLVLYGVFRFALNFFRDDTHYLGLSIGQYLSLATAIVGVWLLVTKYKKSLKRVFA